jgi:hypothetical protein
MSGENAKRGDLVRNLTTGRVGICGGSEQSGRIYVYPVTVTLPALRLATALAPLIMERTSIEILQAA